MKTFLNPELISDCLLFPLFMSNVKEYIRINHKAEKAQ